MWSSHSGVYVHRILEPSLVGLLSKYSNVANVFLRHATFVLPNISCSRLRVAAMAFHISMSMFFIFKIFLNLQHTFLRWPI